LYITLTSCQGLLQLFSLIRFISLIHAFAATFGTCPFPVALSLSILAATPSSIR